MVQVDAFSKEVLAGNQEKRVVIVDSLVDNPATFFPLNAVVYDRTTRALYVVTSSGFSPALSGMLQVDVVGDLPLLAEDGMLAFVMAEEKFYAYDGLTTTWNARFQAASQADSAAANINTLVNEFNALLAKLRAAGLMAP